MAVMDASALNTDPDGMALLADVLGSPVAVPVERRFPIENWTPAARSLASIRFGTVEPAAVQPDLRPAYAE